MKKKLLITLLIFLSISAIGSFIFYKKVLAPIRGEWSLILKQKHKTIYALYGLFKNFDHGTNKLLNDKSLAKAKVLEEINELIEAVEKNSNRTHEAADVMYHLIMYLEANGIKIEEIMQELSSRKK